MNRERPTPAADVCTFLAVAAVIVAYALDDGTYALIARQQAGLLLWASIVLAGLFGLLPAARPRTPLVLALAALGGLGLWSALSLSWSLSDERTLAEVARAAHHLGVLVLVVIAAGRERWLAVVGGASAGAALVSLLSLGVRLAPGLFGSDVTAAAFKTNRLSSPLGYWNAVGAWSAMTALLLLAWSAHARTALVRAAALSLVPGVLLVLYLSYSRAGVADMLAGVLVLLALAPLRARTCLNAAAALALGGGVILVARAAPQIVDLTGTAGRGRVAAALVGGGALAGALALLPVAPVAADRRPGRRATALGAGAAVLLAALLAIVVTPRAWDQFAHTSAAPASADPAARLTNLRGTRYEIYASAVASFREHPLKGSGAGTFEFTWNRDARTPEFVRDAHSLELESLSELGLPGGILVLALLGAGAAMLLGARRAVRGDPRAAGAIAGCAGACSAFVVAASLDWMWELTAIAVLVLVLLGAAGAAALRPAVPPRAAGRAALVLAGLALGALMIPGLREETDLRASRRAVARGDLAAAASGARAAQRAAPWAATPRLQLALVAEQAGELPAARRQLLQASVREPDNWRIPYVLSRVEAARGDAPAALAAYRHARSLRPLGSVFATTPATP